MHRAAWAALGIIALVAAAAALVGAFTRFDADDPPGDPAQGREYEKERYAQARDSALLGILGAFLLLGAAACGQRASRKGDAP